MYYGQSELLHPVKKESKHLLFRVIHAPNRIIKSASSSDADGKDAPPEVKVTGQITVSALVSLSKLIAKHFDPYTSSSNPSLPQDQR
jgi:hypothetical protein